MPALGGQTFFKIRDFHMFRVKTIAYPSTICKYRAPAIGVQHFEGQLNALIAALDVDWRKVWDPGIVPGKTIAAGVDATARYGSGTSELYKPSCKMARHRAY